VFTVSPSADFDRDLAPLLYRHQLILTSFWASQFPIFILDIHTCQYAGSSPFTAEFFSKPLTQKVGILCLIVIHYDVHNSLLVFDPVGYFGFTSFLLISSSESSYSDTAYITIAEHGIKKRKLWRADIFAF